MLRSCIVSLLSALTALSCPARAEQHTADRISLREVDSWAYQLQNLRPSTIAKDGFDVLVVDYARDGSDGTALTRADVDRLRERPGDKARIILAYLSIGEAERYRYYWQESWLSAQQQTATQRPRGYGGAPSGPVKSGPPLARLSKSAPAWLGKENPDWRGNFLVSYWMSEWQTVIYGDRQSYLDRIVAAGFDGVYLDKIDSHEDWQPARPTAEREMVAFVQAIAKHGRAKKPGFLIVPQNGEALLKYPDYVATIDAIAKEDLLYGGGTRRDGEANPEREVSQSKALLDKALASSKPVLTVEYLVEPTQIAAAEQRLTSYGYIPHFATRALDVAPTTRVANAQAAARRSDARKSSGGNDTAPARPGHIMTGVNDSKWYAGN